MNQEKGETGKVNIWHSFPKTGVAVKSPSNGSEAASVSTPVQASTAESFTSVVDSAEGGIWIDIKIV